MALRFLSTLLTATFVWACASSLLAQQTSATCSPHGRYVVGETVVCDDGAKEAHLATWWANSPIGNFCRAVVRDTKRNNCWPEPFIRADREAVREPFVRMVANGWQRQNTLGDHHFAPETGQLNRDGQLKIRRILLEGLPEHRSLWVYRAERAAETTARVEAVRAYATQTSRDGSLPQVFETDLPAPGWPAHTVHGIEEKWYQTMPEPRLPKTQVGEEVQ